MKQPVRILIVEDDVNELVRFRDYVKTRADVVIVAMTKSSREAIEFTINKSPDCVILDIELHGGQGSGVEFLAELKTTQIKKRPIIITATNSPPGLLYDTIKGLGVNYICYKKQSDYSPKQVINTLLLLWDTLLAEQVAGVASDTTISHGSDTHDMSYLLDTHDVNQNDSEFASELHVNIPLAGVSPEGMRGCIVGMIEDELNNLGISTLYSGYDYLAEAIYIRVMAKNSRESAKSALNKVAENVNITYSSVIRAMQTVITKTWDSSDPSEIAKHYTSRVDIRHGYPSPSELINFYSVKILKKLNSIEQ